MVKVSVRPQGWGGSTPVPDSFPGPFWGVPQSSWGRGTSVPARGRYPSASWGVTPVPAGYPRTGGYPLARNEVLPVWDRGPPTRTGLGTPPPPTLGLGYPPGQDRTGVPPVQYWGIHSWDRTAERVCDGQFFPCGHAGGLSC